MDDLERNQRARDFLLRATAGIPGFAGPFTVNGYADGQLDGQIDAAQAAAKLPVKGMDPDKSWSIRYRRGYSEAFPDGGVEVYEQGRIA
jgi:hypothetical protein